MIDLDLVIDLKPLEEATGDLAKKLEERLKMGTRFLALQTHAHVKEQAADKLHTRYRMFIEHYDIEQHSAGSYSLVVYQPAMWIEEGMQEHSMLDDLLASPKAKRAKDGSKYIVVPFKQNKGPTSTTPHQKAIKKHLREELRKQQVKLGGIERHLDGRPKTGLLHKFDFQGTQKRPASGHEGPPGHPLAAHSLPAGTEGPEGRPFLHGVRIYQRLKKNRDGSNKLDKKGMPAVSREIFTFRVASSKQKGSNAWFHPGTPPMKFLDEAYTWAKNKWDSEIAPEILRDLDNI